METKFHLLPIGHHFEWEGKRYVKTTPLIANQIPEGGQRFIPRSALVRLLGEATGAQESAEKPMVPLDSQTVRNALDSYHQRSLQLMDTSPGDAARLAEVRLALEQFYRELLAELKL
jgi:hypothetical protein